MTYTYALLEVSKATYDEIAEKLKAAGYGHAFHQSADGDRTAIDMHGLALASKPEATPTERLDAWAIYCNAFRDLFGHKKALELSPAALQEMLERAARRNAPTPDFPKEPPMGLLVSMALRDDHGLGVPGYYDDGLVHAATGVSHQQRFEAAIARMRQIYEEVSGHGFYSPDKEAEYAARAPSPPAP